MKLSQTVSRENKIRLLTSRSGVGNQSVKYTQDSKMVSAVIGDIPSCHAKMPTQLLGDEGSDRKIGQGAL